MVADLWTAVSEDKRRAAFEAFHEGNPHVWAEFERRALLLIGKGFKGFGARQIVESMRYFYAERVQSDDGFRINNNHVPFYARMFAERHPEHREFFRQRGDE